MSKRGSAGFTLVEIGIVVPIIMVVALALFEIIFAMVTSNNIERTNAVLAYDKETAINNIEPDVLLTSSFLPAPDSNLTDNYKPAGGWSFAGSGGNNNLILRVYSTSLNPLDQNREPVYIGSDATACNASNIGLNPTKSYNVVYFLSGGTLYRRRLVDPDSNTAVCACDR